MGAKTPPVLTEDNPYTQLTLKQKNYVEARLQGLTPAAACRAAGVSDNSTQMERSPKVRKALRYLIKESTKNVADLTKDDVVQGMLDAVDAASTSTELVNAWREIGKLMGVYEPEKKVLELRDYTAQELKTLPEEELVRLSGGKYADAIDGEYRELKEENNVPTDESRSGN